MPRPETCWLSPQVTVSRPINAPVRTPASTAVSRPSHGEPLRNATRNPTNAPTYIVPSMPRFSTPVFSMITSPIDAHTSGVAMVRVAEISASRLMLIRSPPSGSPGTGVRRPDHCTLYFRRLIAESTVSISSALKTPPSCGGTWRTSETLSAPTAMSPSSTATRKTPTALRPPSVATMMPV